MFVCYRIYPNHTQGMRKNPSNLVVLRTQSPPPLVRRQRQYREPHLPRIPLHELPHHPARVPQKRVRIRIPVPNRRLLPPVQLPKSPPDVRERREVRVDAVVYVPPLRRVRFARRRLVVPLLDLRVVLEFVGLGVRRRGGGTPGVVPVQPRSGRNGSVPDDTGRIGDGVEYPYGPAGVADPLFHVPNFGGDGGRLGGHDLRGLAGSVGLLGVGDGVQHQDRGGRLGDHVDGPVLGGEDVDEGVLGGVEAELGDVFVEEVRVGLEWEPALLLSLGRHDRRRCR
mmetsp:Transcript_1732/g.3820  ORF Transcript_1732/g.3820 Transcript_1732/m.3820 type:complete len:282 (-) Transcript_1732:87-932(-)